MTHPIFTAATLEALTIAELKTIASQIGAIPDGNKRIKQTWVSAILEHQTMFSPAKIAAMESHLYEVMNKTESVPSDIAISASTNQLPSTIKMLTKTTSATVTQLNLLDTALLNMERDLKSCWKYWDGYALYLCVIEAYSNLSTDPCTFANFISLTKITGSTTS